MKAPADVMDVADVALEKRGDLANKDFVRTPASGPDGSKKCDFVSISADKKSPRQLEN
ncbi:MAG: hypothetical protein ABI794_12755 [Betaproteobacteria bacterium]